MLPAQVDADGRPRCGVPLFVPIIRSRDPKGIGHSAPEFFSAEIAERAHPPMKMRFGISPTFEDFHRPSLLRWTEATYELRLDGVSIYRADPPEGDRPPESETG